MEGGELGGEAAWWADAAATEEMALSPTLPISQFEVGRMEMVDGRATAPVVRRRVSRKRAARD
eukprot:1934897-Prorocentrum_lima.AAC.1